MDKLRIEWTKRALETIPNPSWAIGRQDFERTFFEKCAECARVGSEGEFYIRDRKFRPRWIFGGFNNEREFRDSLENDFPLADLKSDEWVPRDCWRSSLEWEMEGACPGCGVTVWSDGFSSILGLGDLLRDFRPGKRHRCGADDELMEVVPPFLEHRPVVSSAMSSTYRARHMAGEEILEILEGPVSEWFSELDLGADVPQAARESYLGDMAKEALVLQALGKITLEKAASRSASRSSVNGTAVSLVLKDGSSVETKLIVSRPMSLKESRKGREHGNVSDFADGPTIWVQDPQNPTQGCYAALHGWYPSRTGDEREEDAVYYRTISRRPDTREDRWHEIMLMEREPRGRYGWLENARRRMGYYERLREKWPEWLAWFLAKKAKPTELKKEPSTDYWRAFALVSKTIID